MRDRARAGYYELERLVAGALGKELGLPPDALAARLTAYTLVGGMLELYMASEASRRDDLPALVDRVLEFARAGLAKLTATAPPAR